MHPRLFLLLSLLSLISISALAADTALDEQILQSAKIGTDGPALLEFLRRYTPSHVDPEKVASLVQRLGAEDFADREQAARDLIALGPRAVPYLRQALKERDPELTQRAQKCLDKIDAGPGQHVQAAAVRLLAVRKPNGAAQLLLTYLPYVPNDAVTEDARRSLQALALQGGKPEPA